MAVVQVFLLALACVLAAAAPESYNYVNKVLNHADQNRHADCGSLLKAGYNTSGVYKLHLNSTQVLLPCEFRGDNAFTVILQRLDHTLSFRQPWHLYEAGFGSPHYNFWAGLAHIYALTLQGNNRLQINMQDWSGNNRNAFYSKFYLGDRPSRYRLNVAGFQGNVADDLSYSNQMPFSTNDAPDPHGCATGMQAGWWYNYCAYCLPTGEYYIGGHYTPTTRLYDGMFWKDWQGFGYSLKYISMVISH